jgi:hypothetical protein
MNTVPSSADSAPKTGTRRSSCLATPTKSRRRSFASKRTSSALWWLKMKTAGRADHRFSSPRTRTSMPASAVPRSPGGEREVEDGARATDRIPSGRPSANAGPPDRAASPARTTSAKLGRPRLANRRTGHTRRSAMRGSRLSGLVGRGRPTSSNSGGSSAASL